MTREIIGESIVLVRGRDKVLRAFYNVCPHRGHQLLSGEGKRKCDYLPVSRLGIQTRW
ncbi:Rieske 2Fe-2S domain-containing protein [Escherichia coli]|nr:Rieske 2Fe-2S domain-containing protein [Escherichia coli]